MLLWTGGGHARDFHYAGNLGGSMAPHRHYKIEGGDHVDSFYDDYPDRLRPILPCHRTAFGLLEDWVEDGRKPPKSRFVPKPEEGDVGSTCRIGG